MTACKVYKKLEHYTSDNKLTKLNTVTRLLLKCPDESQA